MHSNPVPMVAADELWRIFPALGPSMAGASFLPRGGNVNSLQPYHALIAAFCRLGGNYLPGTPVTKIGRDGAGFAIVADDE
ncbi:hypothetical protein RHIZO_05060 [Rhizobiaceae bacterium]|nr:hypothetical protein RHIZO_05060 [Rhizobiaceae bacterium]